MESIVKKLLSSCIFMSISLICTSSFAVEQSTIDALTIPDYLGTEIVPLTSKEKNSLNLTGNWIKNGAEPFLAKNGKLIYVHGASMPTILASPMQICDVELQAGEVVNEIIVGDTARWMVETGQVGNIAHIFIKPVDAGLETSAVVTTNRRVYHLRLISNKKDYTPYVGFMYNDEMRAYTQNKIEEKEKETYYASTRTDGEEAQAANLEDLNFDYEVEGKASFKPERIYDDGRQTFIKLPKNVSSREMPVLLVSKGRDTIIVNYRIKENAIVVDGVYDEIILVLGVGNDKEQVKIKAL